MPLGNAGSGPANGSDFQTPGLPHVETVVVAASPAFTRIDFQYVSRGMNIRNSGSAPLNVGFTENGISGSNYFAIPAGESNYFSIRAKSLFLQGDGGSPETSIMAELSMVPSREFPFLTGSTYTENDPGSGWNGVG